MGLNLHFCAIDIYELKSLIGSKNEDIITGIIKTEIFQYFNQNNIWSLSLNEAIKQIIFNKRKNKSFASLYTIAIICIIEYIKKEMPYHNTIQLGFGTDAVNEILSLDFDIADDMEVAFFINRLNLDIPLSTDAPLSGIMKKSDLKYWNNILDPVMLSISQSTPKNIADDITVISERDRTYTFIMGMKKNFSFCIQNKLELFIYTKRSSLENL